MNKIFSFAAYIILAFCSESNAKSPSLHHCLDGDSDTLLKTENIPDPRHDSSKEWNIPNINYIDSGKASSITWKIKPKNISCESTVIARYNGNEIIDLTFHGDQKDFINPNAPFYLKVLAFQTASGLQPFFILSGDNVRWYEQIFESTKDLPFFLSISKTIPGNGVMFSDYTFVFSTDQATLKFISEGGRKMKQKYIEFDFAGNIIRESTSEDE